MKIPQGKRDRSQHIHNANRLQGNSHILRKIERMRLDYRETDKKDRKKQQKCCIISN